MKTLGIIIIVIGLGLTVFTTVPLVTEKKIVDAGPIEINKKTEHQLPWSPIIGILVMAAGAVLLWKSNNN
jgi:LPXTG-motif cell wall-anchored protein